MDMNGYLLMGMDEVVAAGATVEDDVVEEGDLQIR